MATLEAFWVNPRGPVIIVEKKIYGLDWAGPKWLNRNEEDGSELRYNAAHVWLRRSVTETQRVSLMAASFRWIMQLHRDVPKAARFYSEGLDFTVNVCTLRWAELQSGSLKLALVHSPQDEMMQKGYSSLLSFTVSDINSTVAKLMALGAEVDGPIKYEVHGKVAAMRCIDGHVLGLYEPA